jgi:hypothetical protein
MTIIESNSNSVGTNRKSKHKWAKLTCLEFANNLMTRRCRAGNRIKYWGRIGAFGGGISGLFFGSIFIFIPRDGPLLVAGWLASWILFGLAGAMIAGGLSAVGAGIYNLGISHDSILQSETAFIEATVPTGPSSRASTNVERWEHSLLP